MPQVEFTVTVRSITPLSVGAGGSVGTLADKSILRDGWGRPIIPGSQVKGKARHAAEALARTLGLPTLAPFEDEPADGTFNIIRAIFGSPRHRAPLRFADLAGVVGEPALLETLRGEHEQHQSRIRPSVSLNRRRGTAEDARLLFQETALEGTQFHASPAIRGELPDIGHAALLWAALRLTTRWGGAKSRGLGWADIDVTVTFDRAIVPDAAFAAGLRSLVADRGGR